jgi:hypothetical protein
VGKYRGRVPHAGHFCRATLLAGAFILPIILKKRPRDFFVVFLFYARGACNFRVVCVNYVTIICDKRGNQAKRRTFIRRRVRADARRVVSPEARTMAGENGLTAEMRERLERSVIQLLEIAARREFDPALQDELMRLADQISALIEQ